MSSSSSIEKINTTIAQEYSNNVCLSENEQAINKITNNFCFEHLVYSDDIYTEAIGMPIDLEEGCVYLIVSWNTNYKIEGLGRSSFKVIDKRGPALNTLSQYIIVYQS